VLGVCLGPKTPKPRPMAWVEIFFEDPSRPGPSLK